MKKTQARKKCIILLPAAVTAVSLILNGCGSLMDYHSADTGVSGPAQSGNSAVDAELDAAVKELLTVDLIMENEYSRPGTPLRKVSGIAVHYLANPGTTAEENRDYFESLAYSGETYASCHFIIGLDGQILQLIPTHEIAYCTNEANSYSISIECCHPDSTGVFTDETYDSLVLLCAWLCEQYGLTSEDIFRHYDITGKLCPLAFVEDTDYYAGFLEDVSNVLDHER